MSEKIHETNVAQFEPDHFALAEDGLFVPQGTESLVNPNESVLNSAMHMGMQEKGLGSVKDDRTVTSFKNTFF